MHDEHTITISVIKGGFVLAYPVFSLQPPRIGIEQDSITDYVREVFVSVRKMNQRLKEVLDTVSRVPAEKDVE